VGKSRSGEEVDERHLELHVRCRNTNEHNGSGQVTCVKRLLPGLRASYGIDDDVGAEAVGEVLNGLDDVELAGVHRVGGAELSGPLQFGVVGVDGDDPSGADEGSAGDRRVADAAAADDRDGVVAGDRAGVDRRAETGHHPATQQTGDGRVGLGVDFGALAGGHQRLVGERADAERRGEFGAVGQRHLLLGVEGVEAQMWASALAGPALAADRAPVQHDEIAWLHRGHAVADRFDGARGLMA
jgi:hypothetical protein